MIVSLFHALELLERQGLYPFFSFFYENGYQKYFVSLDSELKSFLNEDQQKYAPNNPFNQDRSVTDECLSEPAKKLMKIQGHPKYSILAEKLAEFYQQQPDSKVPIF